MYWDSESTRLHAHSLISLVYYCGAARIYSHEGCTANKVKICTHRGETGRKAKGVCAESTMNRQLFAKYASLACWAVKGRLKRGRGKIRIAWTLPISNIGIEKGNAFSPSNPFRTYFIASECDWVYPMNAVTAVINGLNHHRPFVIRCDNEGFDRALFTWIPHTLESSFVVNFRRVLNVKCIIYKILMILLII